MDPETLETLIAARNTELTLNSSNSAIITSPKTPKKSASQVARALFSFLSYLQANPASNSPLESIASTAASLFTTLRHEVIIHGLPLLEEHHLWTPLENEPEFVNFFKQTYSQNISLIPPLFSQLQLQAYQTNANSFYNPLTHNPDEQTQSSSSTLINIDNPDSQNPTSSKFQSAITTGTSPTLRALVWKTFVLGPVHINQIAIGYNNSKSPSPYLFPLTKSSSSLSSLSLSPLHDNNTPNPFDSVKVQFSDDKKILSQLHEIESKIDSDLRDDQSVNSTAPSTASNPGTTSTTSSVPPSLNTAHPVAILPHPSIYTTPDEYFILLKSGGKAQRYSMIRDDSFRTFRTDLTFSNLVPEQALIRVCNAFDNQYGPYEWKYCQGMNVYAGMFLFVMPELDAYNCFVTYCTKHIPFYWKSNHIGVEAGCALLDRILQLVDRPLYDKLTNLVPQLYAILYAFSFVKTMSASATPLSEVVKLWDLQLAMGSYFNLCCVAAQIIELRDQIMNSSFPKSILDYRTWPKLDAISIGSKALLIFKQVLSDAPEYIIKSLQLHPSNAQVVTEFAGRPPYGYSIQNSTSDFTPSGPVKHSADSTKKIFEITTPKQTE
jgi:hypothetical protein